MKNSKLLLRNQVCFPIYSVSRVITKLYKPLLKTLGLTYPQYLVLMVLWKKDKIAVNKITEQLLLQTNTLSPLLKRMETMDLLKRKRSIEDERIVVVELTEKGANLKNKATHIPEDLLEVLLAKDIELSEVMQLKDALNQWIDVLSKKKK